jgi:hypothetical protein
MREERRLSNEKGENKTRRKREKKKMIDWLPKAPSGFPKRPWRKCMKNVEAIHLHLCQYMPR